MSLRRLSLTLIFITGIIYLMILGIVLFSPAYTFFHVDELTYFLSGKMFRESSSIQAPFCFMEDVSPVFKTHWYGIFYHLFYGSILKITGFHAKIFIVINVVFILLSVLTLFRMNIPSDKKYFIAAMFLMSYPALVYSVMFFPEILHLFMAFPLIAILYRIWDLNRSGKGISMFVMLFICMAALFTLFRITYVFWLAALIPFSVNRWQFIGFTLLLTGGVVLTMLYMKYFTAPAFVKSLASLEKLEDFRIMEVLRDSATNFLYNVQVVFGYLWREVHIFVYLIFFVFTGVLASREKNRFLAAAFLVSLLYILSLLLLYNAYPFYFSKQTATTLPLLITGLAIFTRKGKLEWALLILMIIALPFSVYALHRETSNRLRAGKELIAWHGEILELEKIGQLAVGKKEIVIEVLHYEHKLPSYVFYASLPVSNKFGQPITYTASIHNVRLFPDLKYEDRFIRFGKLPVGFILSREPLNMENVSLLYQGSFFYFYKDNRS